MICKEEKQRRTQCLRKWYFSRSRDKRSVMRRMVANRLAISSDNFYKMLEGRTYISDHRARVINEIENQNCIVGLELNIFALL